MHKRGRLLDRERRARLLPRRLSATDTELLTPAAEPVSPLPIVKRRYDLVAAAFG